jgi:hypothetical protein
VRFSAMPAWPAEGRQDETWSIVAFLKQLPDMTPEAYAQLTAPNPAASAQMPLGRILTPVETKMPRRSEPLDEYSWTVPAAGFGGVSTGSDPLMRCANCHGVDGRGSVTGGGRAKSDHPERRLSARRSAVLCRGSPSQRLYAASGGHPVR